MQSDPVLIFSLALAVCYCIFYLFGFTVVDRREVRRLQEAQKAVAKSTADVTMKFNVTVMDLMFQLTEAVTAANEAKRALERAIERADNTKVKEPTNDEVY